VTTTVDRGGAETLLLNTVTALKKEHQIDILFFKGPGTLLPQFRSLGIEPQRFGPGTLLSTLKLLRHNPGSIIQGWMYHGNLLASLLYLLCGKRGRLFWSVHHSAQAYASSSLPAKIRLKLTALFSSLPHKTVYVSEHVRDEHLSFGYCAKNTAVIHNGINPEEFSSNPEAGQKLRRELGIEQSDLVLGAVGRNHPIKDYKTFFRAVSKLLPIHPHLHVIIVGRDLDLAGFADQLSGLGDTELKRIHLLGERNDVPQILCALDIYALSSLSESFSLSLIEALATQHCCVSTDVIFFRHLFPGVLRTFKAQDAQGMATQVQSFLDLSAPERAQLGRQARSIVVENFSLETMLKRYLALWGVN
jgi:glycosyltransferase involved in cell wall biosynthesis